MCSIVTEWSPVKQHGWLNIFSQLTKETLVSDDKKQKGIEEVEEDVNMRGEKF